MYTLLFDTGGTALVALMLVCLYMVVITKSPRLILLAGIIPAAVANFYCYSSHVNMHNSIVYRIMLSGVPPENPLLAGVPLSYAWLHHFIVALMSKTLSVPPYLAFGLLNIMALAVAASALYSCAGFISDQKDVRVNAVILALIGMSPFLRGPGRRIFKGLSGLDLDQRAYPIIKFISVNSNSLGLMFFALMLLALLSIFLRQQSKYVSVAVLFISLLGVALFYPLLILAAFSVPVAVSLYAAFKLPKKRREAFFTVPVATGMAGFLSLPYLLTLASGRSGASGFFHLSFSAEHLFRNGLNLVMVLIVPVFIVIMTWPDQKSFCEQKTRAVIALSALTPMLLFLFIRQPDFTEYKYLAAGFFGAGMIMAPAFTALKKNKAVFYALLFIFLFPFSSYFIIKGVRGWNIADPYTIKGRWLEPVDTEEARLYRWIRENTTADAVFCDSYLTVPVFSGRVLFIGTDLRRKKGLLNEKRDGWYLTAERLLKTNFAGDPGIIKTREKIASKLLNSSTVRLGEADLDIVRSLKRPFYLVERDSVRSNRVVPEGFKKVYDSKKIRVFQLTQNSKL
ncbi:MAG: hypothetical protein D6719_00260 [Candidatus Dadabacteria bacterium]|nr:MAG: hypothetical protein D6719_00260 [Candidatus Dadabacteria bacterium]